MKMFALGAVLAFAPMHEAMSAEFTTSAKQAVLIEHPSHRVLLAKNADQPMAPSSMAKLMTLYLAFEALAEDRVKPDAAVRIRARAAQAKGATLGFAAGDAVSFAELLRGTAIHSANDAAIALAEHLAGSEEKFAVAMTSKGTALGLARSRFQNATGHSVKNQSATAADLATLAAALLERFPEHYRMFSATDFTFRGRRYANRNPLLGRIAGADGIKTGQTAAGGYGMVASARRGDRRLILVINGLASEGARATEAKRLIEAGFARIGQ